MIILLSLGLLLAPIKTENGRFTIYQDGKRIGTEDFSVVQRQQGYLVEGRTSIGEVKISSRMELNEKLTPTFYEYSDSRNTIRVKIENPISELETTISGSLSPLKSATTNCVPIPELLSIWWGMNVVSPSLRRRPSSNMRNDLPTPGA